MPNNVDPEANRLTDDRGSVQPFSPTRSRRLVDVGAADDEEYVLGLPDGDSADAGDGFQT